MAITITGSSSFQITSSSKQIEDDFISEFGGFSVEKIDGEEVNPQRVQEAIFSLPFLAPKKLVILKNPGRNGELASKITEQLEQIPDTTQLLIIEEKPDKRQAYYKALKTKTDFKELNEPIGNELNKWIVQYARELGGDISYGDAEYLVGRVGRRQELLSHEIDKLILYDNKITRNSIDTMTDQAPQGTIFELLDAAFAKRPEKAIGLYREQRAQKVEPQQIIAMLAWQLHILALVKAGEGKSASEISGAGINPYVAKKTESIAKKLSAKKVKDMVALALSLDIQTKSTNIDADGALERFLLAISS